jgi:hypothetical protein
MAGNYNPPPTERAGSQIEGALFAVVVQTFLGALYQAMNSTTAIQPSNGTESLLSLAASIPGLMTLVGWAIVSFRGGPLALIGFPIGAIGGSMIVNLQNPMPQVGFFTVLLGGLLTWLGVKIGGWDPFL